MWCLIVSIPDLCPLSSSYSYETILEIINMPIHHISKIRLIAIETIKILNKMSPVYLQDLLSYAKILCTPLGGGGGGLKLILLAISSPYILLLL